MCTSLSLDRGENDSESKARGTEAASCVHLIFRSRTVTVDRRIAPPTAASERSMIVSCHAAPQCSDTCHAYLPGYVGFFQFLQNFRQYNAWEQAERILQAPPQPRVAATRQRRVGGDAGERQREHGGSEIGHREPAHGG